MALNTYITFFLQLTFTLIFSKIHGHGFKPSHINGIHHRDHHFKGNKINTQKL